MKLTKTKKRLVVILAVVLVILLAAFLSLWLTGVLHYWNDGMTALMEEKGNYGYSAQKIENTDTVELDLSLPENNLGLILFEDGNARLVVEDYWFEEGSYLKLGVRCYADYDFNHTTYYVPSLVRDTGQVSTQNQTTTIDCIGQGPACHNYYYVVLSIPNYDELEGYTATLQLTCLTRYSYIRTEMGTTLI